MQVFIVILSSLLIIAAAGSDRYVSYGPYLRRQFFVLANPEQADLYRKTQESARRGLVGDIMDPLCMLHKCDGGGFRARFSDEKNTRRGLNLHDLLKLGSLPADMRTHRSQVPHRPSVGKKN